MNFVNRLRANSLPLNTIPPTQSSSDYSPELAALAVRILHRSPLPSPSDCPIYILNSAAFPDAKQDYYDELLPYVLARLPSEDALISGEGYEIIFFAGGNSNSSYANKRTREAEDEDSDDGIGPKPKRPGFGWFMRAYKVLNRITRKRLQKLWMVHEKGWVRVLFEMFATVVSPKFRKKVVHVSSLTALALHMPIEDILIPPSAYVTDRQKVPDIFAPYVSGKRAFGVRKPLPGSATGNRHHRLPRILRETSSFVLTKPLFDTEGLFRVSARQQTVEVLREAYDRGQKFLVWSDQEVHLSFPHHKEGHGDVAIDPEDLSDADGYDVHTAAALIKLWYADLAEPLFPQPSYQALQSYYGDPDTGLDTSALLGILDPGVEYSPLQKTARTILSTHLLPFLSIISSRSEYNKMTSCNLAVCFAPSLLRGPDLLEDVKIMAIVRRLLTAMIEHWETDLAPALGCTEASFRHSLGIPSNIEDREDPLEEPQSATSAPDLQQFSGITLQDNDNFPSLSDDDLYHEDSSPNGPPLPPRPRRVATITTASNLSIPDPNDTPIPTTTPPIPRKPAPPLHTPPRYSSLVPSDQVNELLQRALHRRDRPTNTVEVDVSPIEPPGRSSIDTLPMYEERGSAQVEDEISHAAVRDLSEAGRPVSEMSIPRKPVGEEGKGEV